MVNSAVEVQSSALPEPVPVHIYEFTMTNGSVGSVVIFPEAKDTVERLDGDWVFKFPRLDEDEVIFKHTVCRLKITKTMRRLMSREEMLAEVARRKRVAKETKKAAEEVSLHI